MYWLFNIRCTKLLVKVASTCKSNRTFKTFRKKFINDLDMKTPRRNIFFTLHLYINTARHPFSYRWNIAITFNNWLIMLIKYLWWKVLISPIHTMHQKSKNMGENEHKFFHCEQNSSNLKKMNQIYSNK